MIPVTAVLRFGLLVAIVVWGALDLPVSRPSAGEVRDGDVVREVQRILNATGFQAGEVDGLLGPRTRAAIIRFQEASDYLTINGELDRNTVNAILDAGWLLEVRVGGDGNELPADGHRAALVEEFEGWCSVVHLDAEAGAIECAGGRMAGLFEQCTVSFFGGSEEGEITCDDPGLAMIEEQCQVSVTWGEDYGEIWCLYRSPSASRSAKAPVAADDGQSDAARSGRAHPPIRKGVEAVAAQAVAAPLRPRTAEA